MDEDRARSVAEEFDCDFSTSLSEDVRPRAGHRDAFLGDSTVECIYLRLGRLRRYGLIRAGLQNGRSVKAHLERRKILKALSNTVSPCNTLETR